MASILRQIVASPRLQHPEAGLDLCYVTDDIIATSGPSSNYPQRAYRNPLDALVHFLDSKHDANWAIWEFRAEGTGYPDKEVYGRIHHFPWPDHHPPPFALIPAMMASMRNWLQDLDGAQSEQKDTKDSNRGDKQLHNGKRVAVVHCKAGKGRSGTVACSYLISEQGWKLDDALQRFTERRMRSGFGAGVSIPSQLRWVRYVDRWAKEMNKKYIERPVEILELHVWGLRDGVKVAVEGFVDEGKKIQCYHLFHRSERTVVDNGKATYPVKGDGKDSDKKEDSQEPLSAVSATSSGSLVAPSSNSGASSESSCSTPTKRPNAVIFRPNKPVILPSSDVNIDLERRSKAAYTGWAMVTSIAHIWFNTYFEGGDKHDSNVFEAEWETLDGIKGTTKKGVRALDRLKVVWRYPSSSQLGMGEDKDQKDVITPIDMGQTINEPKPGELIPESHPADWRGQAQDPSEDAERPLREQEKENLVPRHSVTETIDQQQPGSSKGVGHETNHAILSTVSTGAVSAASNTAHSFHNLDKELGLRRQADESQDVSLANSEDEAAGRTSTSSLKPGELQRVHTSAAPTSARTSAPTSVPTPAGPTSTPASPGLPQEDSVPDLGGVRAYFGSGNVSSDDEKKGQEQNTK